MLVTPHSQIRVAKISPDPAIVYIEVRLVTGLNRQQQRTCYTAREERIEIAGRELSLGGYRTARDDVVQEDMAFVRACALRMCRSLLEGRPTERK